MQGMGFGNRTRHNRALLTQSGHGIERLPRREGRSGPSANSTPDSENVQPGLGNGLEFDADHGIMNSRTDASRSRAWPAGSGPGGDSITANSAPDFPLNRMAEAGLVMQAWSICGEVVARDGLVGEASRTVRWRSWREDGRLRITFHGAARQVTGTRPPAGDRPIPDLARLRAVRLRPDRPRQPQPPVHVRPPRPRRRHRLARPQRPHRPPPCLVRAGYSGPIYVTRATGDITSVMLRDSARIQREDVRNGQLRNGHDEPIEPLFELADVEWVVEQLQPPPLRRAHRDRPGRHPDFLRRRPHPRLGPGPARLRRRTAATAGSSSPATSAGATWASCPTRRSSRTSTSSSPRAPTATASSTPTTS